MSKPEKAVGVVTLHRMADRSCAGRKLVADWLRSLANDVEGMGGNFADLFRARYFIAPWNCANGGVS